MADTIKQLNDLEVQIETDFQINFEDISSNKEKNWLPMLSTTITTNKDEITQRFIFDHAQIQETDFGQPPVFHNMQGTKAVIPLKIYDDGLQISAYNISGDNTGNTLQRAADLGRRAALHPKDLATDILENGDTSAYVIFDGQNFFSNTHTKPNSVNIDNLMAGTLDVTNYQAVRVQMMRFASDLSSDDVYGVVPTHTIIPASLEVALDEIINNSLKPVVNFNTEHSKVLKGSSIPVLEPRLSDQNDWFVATTELGLMPFLEIRHSEFGDFDLHSEVSNDDPAFRDHHSRRWWIRAVMSVFPTRPETMIKVVNA